MSPALQSASFGRLSASSVIAVCLVILTVSLVGAATVAGAQETSHDASAGGPQAITTDQAATADTTAGGERASRATQEGTFFETEIVGTTEPVQEGQPLGVTAEIQNTGDTGGTQLVQFTLVSGDETVYSDESELFLDAGETQQVSFSYQTETGDAGELSAGVQTEDTSDSVSVQILEPLNLRASFTPAQPEPDDELTLNIEGDRGGAQVIAGIFDPDGNDPYVTDELTLDENGQASLTVVPEEDLAGAGEYRGIVLDEDVNEEATATVTVANRTEFTVEITNADQQVTAGERITVEGLVTNTGDTSATKPVTFEVISDGGETVLTEQQDVTLASGESQAVEFGYDTQPADTPGVTVGLSTAADQTQRGVEVQPAEAEFSIELAEVPEEVTAGEDIPVTATVTNEGSTQVTETVAFEVKDETEETIFTDDEQVTLESGETTEVLFSYESTPSDEPGVIVSVSGGNDTATTTVDVNPQAAAVTLDITSAPEQVTAGEEIPVTATVLNQGQADVAGNVSFTVLSDDGEQLGEGEQAVQIGPGDTETVEFSYESQPEDVPGITVVVSGFNESKTRSVEVQPAEAEFSIELAEVPEEVTAGEDIPVTATVTNEGSTQVTETVAFEVKDETEETIFTDDEQVTLESGETTEVVFSYESTPSDEPGVVVSVSGGNDTATAPVDVNAQAAAVTVDITSAPEQVTAGETIPVTATVTNTGGATQTQTISFEITADGETVFTDQAEITLEGEESGTVEFSYESTTEDAPEVVATVASENQSESQTVAVTEESASLQVTPQTLTFPTTTAGTSTAQSVQLQNTGSGTLTISGAAVTGDDEEFVAAFSGLTLDPGEQQSVTITFLPLGAGEYEAVVEFLDADQNARGSVELSGAARAPPDDDEEDEQEDEQEDDEGDEQEDDEGDEQEDGEAETTVDEEVERADDEEVEITAEIENATAGEPVDIDMPVAEEEQEYATENVSVVTTVDTDATVNITSSSGALDTTPTASFPANGTTQLGNLSVTSTLAPDDIERVSFTFWVNASRVEQYDSTAEDIALYRYNEQQDVWVQKETDVLERDGDQIRLRGIGQQFSEWSVAIRRPEFNITETDVEVGAATTEEEIVIQVFVTNTGGADGTYEAQLLTNEEVVETKDATVPEGGTVLVTFLRTFGQPGLYEVQVNEVPVGEIEISEEDETVEVSTPDPVTETETSPDSSESTATETPGAETDEETDGIFGPGFGIVSALGGLSALGYLLRRRSEPE